MPERQDVQWMKELLERSVPGAKWVKIHSIGETRTTIAVRTGSRSASDGDVQDREAFLAGLHRDIWEARLMRADADGETYHVTFTTPRQMSFA